MAEILEFLPNNERTSQENLAEFIRVCRDELTVFGTELNWQDNSWKTAGAIFGNLDKTLHKLTPANTFRQPFLDFAKAYIRYQQGHHPAAKCHNLKALKCVERALFDCNDAAEIRSLTSEVLDRAAVLARAHYAPAPAYHAGRQIAHLAAFVSEKKIVQFLFDWKNPIGRPLGSIRTGVKARKQREKQLPSNEVLDALADIFAENPRAGRDIFTTSVVAILLCAPSRISEVLSLREDCEVWETKRNGTSAYGLRFQPGKGGAPMVKWIPDSVVGLAREAIRRIRDITAEARRIAWWLETHPDLFYRHKACPNMLESEPLSVIETAMALGIRCQHRHYAANQLRLLGLPSRNGTNTLGTLNQWVHNRLPIAFPWFDKERGVRFSEALFCLRKNQLHRDFKTSNVIVWKPVAQVVNRDLCRSITDGNLAPSIFDRHNRKALGKFPLKANTHQFRHLLNTMAQRGGLGQAEIARWSGRVEAKQNRAYDHMSEFELADLLRRHDSTLTLDRPLAEIAEQITTQIPMTQQEFNTLAIPTAHVTEFGFCIHDFVMSPCQRFRDCLNCSEQVCIKGDKRLDRIRIRYAQIKQLKERAEEAIACGSAGADRWYEIQSLTETRLAALIGILEDPSIKDGTIVRLKNEHEFSPLRRALDARASATFKSQTQLPVLTGLHVLTGGGDGKAS